MGESLLQLGFGLINLSEPAWCRNGVATYMYQWELIRCCLPDAALQVCHTCFQSLKDMLEGGKVWGMTVYPKTAWWGAHGCA